MPAVHKQKSRAKHFYDGVGESRARLAIKTCSWFVLGVAITMSNAARVGVDLQTVICQVPSVSRESGADAKLQQPADASLTICWCQFEQA
jgi:hypothetical protein